MHAAQRMHLVVSSNRSRSFGRLHVLPGRLVAVGDQERLDRAVGVEERLHVDDQVLEQRQALDRLDGHLVALVADQVLDQHLAAQPVSAVDPHRVGPADAVRAGPAEGQRAVDVPLDVVQHVEQPVAGQRRHPVGLRVRQRRRARGCTAGCARSASTAPSGTGGSSARAPAAGRRRVVSSGVGRRSSVLALHRLVTGLDHRLVVQADVGGRVPGPACRPWCAASSCVSSRFG